MMETKKGRERLGFRDYWQGSVEGFSKHRHTTLAAAIAFRALFSAVPFIVLFGWGYQWVQSQWLKQTAVWPGMKTEMGWAQDLAQLKVEGWGWLGQQPGWWIFAIGLLIYGASTVFREVVMAFELIWEVKTNKIWKQEVWRKLVAVGLVFGLALMLALAIFGSWFLDTVANNLNTNHEMWGVLVGSLSRGLLPLLTFGLLVCIYMMLPKVKIRIREVWLGALTATVLFWVGQTFMGWFLGEVDLASTYGVAGSIVMFLWWCYYTALILLLGAEITRLRYNWQRTRE